MLHLGSRQHAQLLLEKACCDMLSGQLIGIEFRKGIPVEILSGMAHAVDAVIAGKVAHDRVFQCIMVLPCHVGAAAEHTA